MSPFRLSMARTLVALLLTLALPAPWDAFCGGWQTPQQAMACCHRASHDEGPSAAFSCCAAQEQTRHAQSPVTTLLAVPLEPVSLPVPATVPARLCLESPRRARSADARLLASVFLI